MITRNKAGINMQTRHSDSADGKYILKREIPLWGILTIAISLLGGSYSMYASYVEMAKSVDRLSASVEKLRDSQIQYTIKDNQHDNQIANHALAIQDLRRDIEDLKKSQKWTPK